MRVSDALDPKRLVPFTLPTDASLQRNYTRPLPSRSQRNREGLTMTSCQNPRAFTSFTIDAQFSTKPRRRRFHAVSRTPSAPLRTERLRVYRVQLPAP